jgi:hypothetical protein
MASLSGTFVIWAAIGYPALYATASSSSSTHAIDANLGGQTACVNRVLDLARLGVVRSVSAYDTAILPCNYSNSAFNLSIKLSIMLGFLINQPILFLE